MGLTFETGIPVFTVFLQGILSFFSPCVLPLVPLYIGYLSGGAKTVNEDGTIQYKRSKVMLNTMFFVLGVSFAFFLLGFGFTAAGQFFADNRLLFARVGGVLVVLFGLFQLGVFGSGFLSRERRIPLNINKLSMNPLVALLMGFTFSFAWTPCVGPALGSVLLMASSAKSAAWGFTLVGVYTLGFVIPFLAVGLFTGGLLALFKKHQKVVNYTVKAGGVLMILMGVMMFTGLMNGITGYLSGLGGSALPPASTAQPSPLPEASPQPTASPLPETDDTQKTKAPDFTLTDQNGETHTLSDYEGKVVFLNFWATWCGPCKEELPDIQALYEEQGGNEEDLVVLGIANPKSEAYPNNADVSEEEILTFLTDNHISYPVVMDQTGESFAAYRVSAFPTTFLIDTDGNLFGYATGTITKEMMESFVEQTKSGVRE